MKMIMKEYGKLILTAIVAALLLALIGVVLQNNRERMDSSIVVEEVKNEELEILANINNPTIVWRDESYKIDIEKTVSIPELFLATSDGGEELRVEVLNILYENKEILAVEGEGDTKQDVEVYQFRDAGIYELRIRAVDTYGNDTIRNCHLVVNQ